MRTALMPWSFWVSAAICTGLAIQQRSWQWAAASLAVIMIGIGIRAWTDGLHYKNTHKGEDHDGKTGPLD